MDELVDGGDEFPDVAEHEQPHDAQRDAGQPVTNEKYKIKEYFSSLIVFDLEHCTGLS